MLDDFDRRTRSLFPGIPVRWAYSSAILRQRLAVRRRKSDSVAKALEIIDALENGKTTADKYRVKGFVVGTPAIEKKDDGTFYGNANFYLADEKGGATTIYGYHIKGLENESMNAEDYLKEGDEVIVLCKLQKFVKNDVVTPEMTSGYIYSLNGKTTSVAVVKATAAQNAATYNLAGQQVGKGYKGIVIVNGKKMIQK